MFVHDLTDVPLDLVRLFGCWNWLNAQAIAMFITLGMWGYWRLYYFPVYLWWSSAFGSKVEVFGHECRFEPFPNWYVFRHRVCICMCMCMCMWVWVWVCVQCPWRVVE